eukprot:TRINITY_DN7017_c0_g1_i1.p1 TRINITY_DN7017_c0_g1~~TRINITY_DN7017_c0_g1_i1.p1  ORF type:complete len:509 (-),score=194.85 TRINITY_DN7017_c0_g1_i1:48-1574(-)
MNLQFHHDNASIQAEGAFMPINTQNSRNILSPRNFQNTSIANLSSSTSTNTNNNVITNTNEQDLKSTNYGSTLVIENPKSNFSAIQSYVCQNCSKPMIIDSSLQNRLTTDINSNENKNNQILSPPINFNSPFVPITPNSTPIPYINAPSSNASNIPSPAPYECIPDLSMATAIPIESIFSSIKNLPLDELFKYASSVTQTDLPICNECAKKIIKELENRASEYAKEYKHYSDYLNKLQSSSTKETEEDLDKQIEELIKEEQRIKEQFRLLENEKEKLNLEKEMLEFDFKKMELFEECFWQNSNDSQHQSKEYEEERDSLTMKIKASKEQLEKLKKTNVYNDTFHIWFDGHFGTINNFRLGRLSSQQVDWSEINAAWGQAILLLQSLSKKLNYNFVIYKLIPMGSMSKIERISDKEQLALYCNNSELNISRFWNNRKFEGVTAFVDCTKQLGTIVIKKDNEFKFPYKMESDKVGDQPIILTSSNEETWTKAMKYLLTNLKWLLVAVSNN